MKLILCLAFTLLLTGFTAVSGYAEPPPLLLGDAPSYHLAGHLEQFVDPSGKLTLADLLTPARSARFTPIPGNMNRGYTRDAVWLRFRMTRTASFPEDSYLRLGPPFIDTITVFIQAGDDQANPAAYRQVMVGDHVPLGPRAVHSPDYVIPLNMPPAQSRTVYLKVCSTSTLTLVGAIHTPAAMIGYDNLNILLNGGYLAVALVIVLINLIFFWRRGIGSISTFPSISCSCLSTMPVCSACSPCCCRSRPI